MGQKREASGETTSHFGRGLGLISHGFHALSFRCGPQAAGAELAEPSTRHKPLQYQSRSLDGREVAAERPEYHSSHMLEVKSVEK